jgi:hypothetical protein
VRQRQEERHVVDAGDVVAQLGSGQPDVRGELARGVLHRVAQPDAAHEAALGDGPAQHCHRVDVLQQERVRAALLHVAAHVEEDGDRPQPAHDPADAERGADRLAQAEALGDVEVDDRRGAVAADLERRDDVVGAVERGGAVERRLDAR